MTQQLSPGAGIQLWSYGMPIPDVAGYRSNYPGSLIFTTGIVDAAAEKFSMIGRITLADRGAGGSRTISSAGGKIHAFLGATTFANVATSLDVGIQDITAGGQDADGVFDVKGTYVGGTDTLTGSAINSFAMETGTKTIAHNDLLAVVFELTARGGTDSVGISVPWLLNATNVGFPYCRFFTAAAWGQSLTAPNVLIEFNDGTYGWFQPYMFRPDADVQVTYNLNTPGADECGARFTLPWPVDLEAITVPVMLSTSLGSDFELCIYSDITGAPTLVGSAVTFDASQSGGQNNDTFITINFPALKQLSANTVYGWTVRPTTTNGLRLDCIDYGTGNNSKMACLPMGRESYRIKRLNNAGAFTLENTIHVPHVLHIAKFSDGLSGRAQYALGGF